VPVEDEESMRRWYDVLVAAAAADSPGIPESTFPEVLGKARAARDVAREDYWAGHLDGEPVGVYRLRVPLRDNLDTTMLALAVHPGHRHRGHGRALMAHAADQVRDMGRRRVWVEVVEPADGSTGRAGRFAAAAGFRRALPQMRRVLTLDHGEGSMVDRLDRLEQDVRAHTAGYELVSWTAPCPEELADDYAVLLSMMSVDAPLDDLDLEPEQWDAGRVRQRDEVIRAQGRTPLATAARQGPAAPLVAFTDLGVTRHDPDNAFQWDTLVLGEHRGHRLGTWVKLANLRLLRAQAPQVRQLHTWNADSNAHMVAINDALGFLPVQREVEWQLDLPAVD